MLAAQYIPQLSNVNPDYWAVSICTVDGQRYSVGDVKQPFTIQSCSKPLTYAIACADNGPDMMHQYIGLEPSGRFFNELCLDYKSKLFRCYVPSCASPACEQKPVNLPAVLILN
ncbi:Glutaminase [Trinorchestia longiramus]|nr:Glutaminase [Trinorchestia longiramus]